MKTIYRISVFALLLGTSLAQTQPIDTEHSVVTVRVFKSGLFSAFADNHEIRAPISAGVLDEAERVEIVVDSRKLVVLDPNLPPEKRQQVEERMLGPEVLDANQFHEIRFHANHLNEESADHFFLAGTLSLHGKTRPISLHVVRSSGHYRGDVILKHRQLDSRSVSIGSQRCPCEFGNHRSVLSYSIYPICLAGLGRWAWDCAHERGCGKRNLSASTGGTPRDSSLRFCRRNRHVIANSGRLTLSTPQAHQQKKSEEFMNAPYRER
jgi:hypothetical protein